MCESSLRLWVLGLPPSGAPVKDNDAARVLRRVRICPRFVLPAITLLCERRACSRYLPVPRTVGIVAARKE